jgi:hypothetical protein
LYNRSEHLGRIFKCFERIAKLGKLSVLISTDRATEDVRVRLQEILKYTTFETHSMEAGPLVDENGEHFMRFLDLNYRELRKQFPGIEVASLWDDDFWLDAAGIKELKEWLKAPSDRFEWRSAFLWDGYTHLNDRFNAHWQALFFKVYEGDEYDVNWMQHAPQYVSSSLDVKQAERRILNAGYLTEKERERTWLMYKNAGKIDAHTLCLVQEPTLVKVSEVNK